MFLLLVTWSDKFYDPGRLLSQVIAFWWTEKMEKGKKQPISHSKLAGTGNTISLRRQNRMADFNVIAYRHDTAFTWHLISAHGLFPLSL